MSNKKKIGLSPGSLVYTGKMLNVKPVLKGLAYNPNDYSELSEKECLNLNLKQGFQYWLDLKGINDVNLISQLGEKFNIHRLILEDVLDPGHRIKIEDYDAALFGIIYNIEYNKETKTLKKEQISIYLNKTVLISFQEDPDDSFAIIRNRMQMPLSRIRNRGTDYLFYAIIDYLVDRYYITVEAFHDEFELLEEKVLQDHIVLHLEDLHILRNNILAMKRVVFPLREEINQLKNLESNLIDASTFLFLRDLQDNIQHLIETLDNQRELLNGIRELVMSRTNLQMNKDMKWLAMVSTVSIPILFFTGVYGMNFEFMPELKWRYGYLVWWLGVSAVLVTMIGFLKRKKMF